MTENIRLHNLVGMLREAGDKLAGEKIERLVRDVMSSDMSELFEKMAQEDFNQLLGTMAVVAGLEVIERHLVALERQATALSSIAALLERVVDIDDDAIRTRSE